jgi:predicted amidohydrolase YtcJ
MPRTFAILGRVRPDVRGGRDRAALLVQDGRVRGYEAEASAAVAAGAPVLRLPERWLVHPAFRDPHVHLLGIAAASLSIDCRAERAPDLAALLETLRAAAASRPPGTWLRAFGYDEALLVERRGPGPAELAAAVPDHPLVLRHRAGHLALLNRRACAELERHGVAASAERPIPHDALPAGLTPLQPDALERAVGALSEQLARAGVVAVGDATAANDGERLATLRRMRERGVLRQDVVFMPGVEHLGELAAQGFAYGERGDVSIGHAKVIPRDNGGNGDGARRGGSGSGGGGEAWLRAAVAEARRAGFCVAVHVLDPEQLDATLRTLAVNPAPHGGRDRIEHLALCLPEQLEQVRRAGVSVVSNPAFLLARARKYAHELSTLERSWLYPIGSLLDRRTLVAAASDAPVTDCAPLLGAQGAVSRDAESASERVDVDAALGLISHGAAAVLGAGDGRLAPGRPADLVILDEDPRVVEPGRISQLRVLATLKSGSTLFAAPEVAERREMGARRLRVDVKEPSV